MIKLLKQFSGQKIIAAVGDGDNDAGMLNEADLGITVAEKGNSLASFASDLSIH
jgi:P-type E1-E2 ATPase